MLWIQDIVPNHMGFHHHNAWLMDVLKKGEDSSYRKYFDILSPDLTQRTFNGSFFRRSSRKSVETARELEVEAGREWFLKVSRKLWPLKAGTDA